MEFQAALDIPPQKTQQYGTAMLFMESWPAPALGDTAPPPSAYPAPHVIACAHAAVLLDLHRAEIDMVVWGRRVPNTWQMVLGKPASSGTIFDMLASSTEIANVLASKAANRELSPLVLGDAIELSSLFSAITHDSRQHLRLLVGATDGPEFAPAPNRLRLVCCYGSSSTEWRSSAGITSLPPYAVALIKGTRDSGHGCLHRFCRAAPDETTSGIHIIIDTVI